MDGWLVTLSRTPTPHATMPALEEVIEEPSAADERTLLPLFRLHLDSVEGRPEQWPEWAPGIGYLIGDYGALPGAWPTFTMSTAGTLTHDIPPRAFLDEPVVREGDVTIISGGASEQETTDRYWRIHEVRDAAARRSGRQLAHGDLDQLLALPPGEAKRVLSDYPTQRLALAPWLAVEPVSLPHDPLELESVWDAWVRTGVVVGMLLEHPIGLPAARAWPVDDDGTPLKFLGQFKADNLTAYLPGSIYWLFWSSASSAFVQVDARD